MENLDSATYAILMQQKIYIEECEDTIKDQAEIIAHCRRSMELQSKSFLRCARDLKHIACDIMKYEEHLSPLNSFAIRMSQRSDMWLDVAKSPEGYKDKVYAQIRELESKITNLRETIIKYQKYCSSNGIDWFKIEQDGDGRDIPF